MSIKDMSISELWEKIISERMEEQSGSNASDNMEELFDRLWEQVENGTLELSEAETELAKRLTPKCPNCNCGEPNECKCQWHNITSWQSYSYLK